MLERVFYCAAVSLISGLFVVVMHRMPNDAFVDMMLVHIQVYRLPVSELVELREKVKNSSFFMYKPTCQIIDLPRNKP